MVIHDEKSMARAGGQFFIHDVCDCTGRGAILIVRVVKWLMSGVWVETMTSRLRTGLLEDFGAGLVLMKK